MRTVPVTAAHIEALGGARPTMTIWGLTVVDGERPLGVAAIYPGPASLMLIARIGDEGRTRLAGVAGKRALLAAAREMLTTAERRRMPIYAVADPDIPGSDRLLTHLGFKPYHKETYKWHGSR